jgi:flagellar hook-associated protein FlgK
MRERRRTIGSGAYSAATQLTGTGAQIGSVHRARDEDSEGVLQHP